MLFCLTPTTLICVCGRFCRRHCIRQ